MGLPALREELDLFEGPRQAKGQPTWVLHDPVRQQFFRIDWVTFEILSRWSLNDPQAIIHAIERDTPLEIDVADLEKTVKFLSEQQLLRPEGFEAVSKMAERKQAAQSSWWQWLIHHYLFFRMPLVRPDRWLERWLPVANLFFSRRFMALTAGALVLGLYQVSRQWDHFSAFLWDTLSLEGLASYGVALFSVKLLHELGHAFAVKRNGGRVPTMGIAFLVMFPMAYTDTNEAWRMPHRWQRLQVSAAGIVTEGIVAVWATVAWAFLPDGALRSSMFFLAAISWGISLLLNASPFMRFDGYFILCDALDIPNLHQRSFAVARWKMREWLFGLNEKPPEIFSPFKQKAMLLMAFATWIYRLVLFLGIALMVYHMFTKLLGTLLFCIEIYWFIWFPVRAELKEWLQRKQAIQASRRSVYTAIMACAVLVLVLLPLPAKLTVTALLKPGQVWPVHAPGPAHVLALHAHDGQEVAAGQALVSLQAPDVQLQLNMSAARWQSSQWKSVTASMPDATGTPLALSHTQLDAASAELRRARQQSELYKPTAPFAGRFVLSDPDMARGQWVDKKEKIGTLIGPGPWRIETWLDEAPSRRIRVGSEAHFMASGMPHPILARVVQIDADSSRTLEDGQLTAAHGGHIVVREQSGQWWPEQAVYKVTLELQEPAPPGFMAVQRGNLSIHAEAQSLAAAYARHALSVLIRELMP
jgi:putative peptide zinc metalloprotease protein